MERKLKKGDTIRCSNADELLDLMHVLEKEGYKTDFLYEREGKEGLWLEIIEEPVILTVVPAGTQTA